MNAIGPEIISNEIEALLKGDETRKELPRDIVARWFRDCSFDEAKEKLATAGFNVGEYSKLSNSDIKQGITRVADGEKKLRDVFEPGSAEPVGAHLLRVTLLDYGGRLDVQTLIYTDGP
jgi:hypothetical protein